VAYHLIKLYLASIVISLSMGYMKSVKFVSHLSRGKGWHCVGKEPPVVSVSSVAYSPSFSTAAIEEG
jgi:hypothetical protein